MLSLRRIRSWLRRGHRYAAVWLRVVVVHAQCAGLRAVLELRSIADPRVREALARARREKRIF